MTLSTELDSVIVLIVILKEILMGKYIFRGNVGKKAINVLKETSVRTKKHFIGPGFD